jgi:hypothetical protein
VSQPSAYPGGTCIRLMEGKPVIMGLLENPAVAPVAQACQDEIGRVLHEVDVRMTPFAGEIMTLFITSALFEPAIQPEGLFQIRTDGEDLYRALMGSIRPIIQDIIDTSSVRFREDETRDWVMTADVYHWLSERSRRMLGSLPCPFAK